MIVGVTRRGRSFYGMGDMVNGQNGQVDIGVEDQLADPTGQDAQTLHDRLGTALAYIPNFQSAIAGSKNEGAWRSKIGAAQQQIQQAYDLMNPDLIFPGKTELAAYYAAAGAYADLWRTLSLSPDTVKGPSITDLPGGIWDTLTSAPGAAYDAAGNAINKTLGAAEDTASALKWTVIGVGGLAAVFLFYLTWETGRTARSIGPGLLR